MLKPPNANAALDGGGGFLRGIRGHQFLTKKQLAKLEEIIASVRRSGA